MHNSRVRFELIESTLKKSKLISKDGIKRILSDLYPNGLCCHYYTEFFGTMNSVIYDPNEMKIDLCFGPSDINPWYSMKFDEIKNSEYEVFFPKEKAPNGFWEIE